jgi:hypothetical protein
MIQNVLGVVHKFGDSQDKITSAQGTTRSKNKEIAIKNDLHQLERERERERERLKNLNQNRALDQELISHRRIFRPIEGGRTWGERTELKFFEMEESNRHGV